jgi:hypothetical protein
LRASSRYTNVWGAARNVMSSWACASGLPGRRPRASTPGGVEHVAVEEAALDDQLGLLLGPLEGDLGRHLRLAGGPDHRRRPLEELGHRLERRALDRDLHQRVLQHAVVATGLAEVVAHGGHGGDREARVLDEHDAADVDERRLDLAE